MTIFDRAFEHADDTTAVTAARRIAQKVLDNPRADDAARSAALKVLNSDDAAVSRAIPRAVQPATPTSPNQRQSPAPSAAASTRDAGGDSPGRTPWLVRAGAGFIRGRERTADVSSHGVLGKGRVESLLKKGHADSLFKKGPADVDVVLYSPIPGMYSPGWIANWYDAAAAYDAAAETIPFAAAAAAAGVQDDSETGELFAVGEKVALDIEGPDGRHMSVLRVPIKRASPTTGDARGDEKQ